MSTISAGLVQATNLTVTGTQSGAVSATNVTAENLTTTTSNATNLYIGGQAITQSELNAFVDTQKFITTWNVDANTVVLPLPNPSIYAAEYPGVTIYDFIVLWGDGNQTTINASNYNTANSHTYTVSGQVTVTITGTIRGFSFGSVPDSADMITSVVQWGCLQLINNSGVTVYNSVQSYLYSIYFSVNSGDVSDATKQYTVFDPEVNGAVPYANFFNCVNLTLDNVKDTPNLSSAGVLTGMFLNCTSLVTINNLKGWNTSSIEDFSLMFAGCPKFNSSISGWNISSVLYDLDVNGSSTAVVGNYAGMSFMFAALNTFNSEYNNAGEALFFTGVPASNSAHCMFLFCTSFNNGDADGTSNKPFVLDTSTIYDMSFMFY